jgi:GMP synthase-like glutamine amidotransferase
VRVASALGAPVVRQARPELGVHDVYLADAGRRDPLFSGLAGRLAVFGWHEDRLELPPGAVPLAGSIACTYEAFRFDVATYGLQFHPEVRAGELAGWAYLPGYRRLLSAVDAAPITSPMSSRGPGRSWTSSRASCSSAGSALLATSRRPKSSWEWRSERDGR